MNDLFKQMMEAINRQSQAVGVYFAERIVKWWEDDIVAPWNTLTQKDETPAERKEDIDQTVDQSTKNTALDINWDTVHAEIREELEDAARAPWPWSFIRTTFIRFSLIFGQMSAYSAAINALRSQRIHEDIKPSLASIDVLLRAELLNPGSTGFLDPIIAKWGLPESSLLAMRSAMKQLPAITEVLVLLRRDLINRGEAQDYLEQQGFNAEDTDNLLELRLFYPGAADLVTLAGREAFEEDQITAFELDKDFDKIPKEVFHKAGVTDEVARWYWIAHWSNPSIQQFFEMVHRKAERKPGVPWRLEDAETYARLADINPAFVPGLRDIAYRPLTRVDVRRMYQDGVLDYAGIEKSYTDLGYSPVGKDGSPSDVTLMSDWTKKYAERGERTLTKTQLVNMFELRQLSRRQLSDQLELIGYEADQASTLSWLADGQREEKRLRSFIRRGEYEYKRGLETPEIVRRALLDEDIEPDQVEELFEEWNNEAVFEQALPSKEDVLGWYPSRIDEAELRGHLRALRYTDANIDLYVQSEGEARLSKTDILRLYDQREIMEEKALSELKDLGYSVEDAMALLGPVTRRIERREELEQAESNNGRTSQGGNPLWPEVG